jgi:hypothetical protein
VDAPSLFNDGAGPRAGQRGGDRTRDEQAQTGYGDGCRNRDGRESSTRYRTDAAPDPGTFEEWGILMGVKPRTPEDRAYFDEEWGSDRTTATTGRGV